MRPIQIGDAFHSVQCLTVNDFMSIGDTRVVAQRDAMSELVVCLNSMGVYLSLIHI